MRCECGGPGGGDHHVHGGMRTSGLAALWGRRREEGMTGEAQCQIFILFAFFLFHFSDLKTAGF